MRVKRPNMNSASRGSVPAQPGWSWRGASETDSVAFGAVWQGAVWEAGRRQIAGQVGMASGSFRSWSLAVGAWLEFGSWSFPAHPLRRQNPPFLPKTGVRKPKLSLFDHLQPFPDAGGIHLEPPGVSLQPPGIPLDAPGIPLRAPGMCLRTAGMRLHAPGIRLPTPETSLPPGGIRLPSGGMRRRHEETREKETVAQDAS